MLVNITSVINVVTETGNQEAKTGDGAEVLPPARVDEATIHHLGHSKGMSPVMVNNLE